MPGPGLVVRGGHESAPGTSGTDDAKLRTFQMASSWRLRAIWLSRNEAVLFIGAWERPSRASAIGGRPLASELARIGTAETTRALEEERLSVETQGENEYGRDR